MTLPTNAYPMRAMCANCGKPWSTHYNGDNCNIAYGGHFVLDIAHPINAGIPVYNPPLAPATAHPNRQMSDVCALCGDVWGNHHGVYCANGSGKFTALPKSASPAPAPAPSINPPVLWPYLLFGFARDGSWQTWVVPAKSLSDAETRLLRSDPLRTLLAFDDHDSNPTGPTTAKEFYDDVTDLIRLGYHCTADVPQAWALLHQWIKDQHPDLGEGAEIAKAVSHLASLPTPAPGPRKPPMTETVQDWLTRETATPAGRQRLMDRAWEATVALAKGA